MDKARKIDILYKRAKGQPTNATKAELSELRKYKVDRDEDDTITTRANIKAYVEAVDQGSRRSFDDWCKDKRKGDKRYNSGKAKGMDSYDKEKVLANIFVGWLFWGMAIYWLRKGTVPAGSCAVAGIVISAVVFFAKRKWSPVTNLALPLAIALLAYTYMQ